MKKLHDLVLTVSTGDFETPDFVSGGAVARAGNYQLRSETTLLEALYRLTSRNDGGR